MVQNTSAWSPAVAGRPWRGMLWVLGLHAALFAALVWGWGGQMVPAETRVVMAQFIDTPEPEPPVQQPLPPEAPQRPPPVAKAVVPAPDMSVPAAQMPATTLPAEPVPVANAAPAPPPVSKPVERMTAKLQASGRCKKPEYPLLSRRKEEQGTVLLQFLIGVDGQVLESKVLQSSGFARLDEAARLALAQCQFQPGSVDGTPEPSWANVKYIWKLQDE